MRVLMTTWAWPSHLMPMVQLGWALRSSGHEVIVAGAPSLTQTALDAGLPVVAIGENIDIRPMSRRYFEWLAARTEPVRWEDIRHWGAGNVAVYTMIADRTMDDALDFAIQWKPDVVVFDPTTFVGPLIAAALKLPAIRHVWGMDYTYRTHDVESDAIKDISDRLGLGSVDTLGAASIDPCPPSLQYESNVVRLSMRHVPYNGPAQVLDWMLDTVTRPRVCVVGSSAVAHLSGVTIPFAAPVLDALADMDVDVVAVVPDSEVDDVGDVAANVTIVPPTPLHLLLSQCSLVIHQGGGGTVMTALSYGVPQLLLPLFTDHVANAEQLAKSGAGAWIFAKDADSDTVRAQVDILLSEPSFRENAWRLSQEIAEAPSAADVVESINELVERWGA